MQQELQKVIVGQNEVIEQLFAAIFTRGHCLLEGVPGLGKTLLVRTLGETLVLPPWLETQRGQIESIVPTLTYPPKVEEIA